MPSHDVSVFGTPVAVPEIMIDSPACPLNQIQHRYSRTGIKYRYLYYCIDREGSLEVVLKYRQYSQYPGSQNVIILGIIIALVPALQVRTQTHSRSDM
jgi:hypothetical protein